MYQFAAYKNVENSVYSPRCSGINKLELFTPLFDEIGVTVIETIHKPVVQTVSMDRSSYFVQKADGIST